MKLAYTTGRPSTVILIVAPLKRHMPIMCRCSFVAFGWHEKEVHVFQGCLYVLYVQLQRMSLHVCTHTGERYTYRGKVHVSLYMKNEVFLGRVSSRAREKPSLFSLCGF